MKLFLLAFLFTISTAFGQQTINDLTVKKFTVVNTKLGSKPCPLMSESQRDAIAIPESGDCIYNTTSLKLNTYDGSDWKAAGGGGIDAWVPAFDYKAGNLVVHNKKIYSALIDHTSTIFSTDLAGGKLEEVSQGVTDHTQLTNIGTNTHPQIDSHIANNANPHAVTKAQVGLSAVPNIDTSTTSNISDFLNKRFVLDSDLVLISTIAGKQDRSALTLKGDLYGATASAITARVPVGNSGELLTATPANSTGLGYRSTKENNELAFSFNGFEDISTWQKGNAATVVLPATGSFAGSLQGITSGPLNDSASYRYTQATGSLNDYWCSPTKSITPAQKGETYFTANYTYDGQSGDLQPYLYDVTNSGLIPLVSIKGLGATNTSLPFAYAALIPQTTSQVSLCYQVRTLNSGKVFNYATVQLTKVLSSLGTVANYNIQSERVANNAATVSGTSGNIRFNTTRITKGSGNIVTSDNGTNTLFTAIRETQINFCAKAIIGTTGSFNIYLNGSSVESAITTATGGNDYQQICANLAMNAGDYLTVVNTVSLRLALADYNFTSIAIENPQVSSSNQITSSDSIVFVHKTTAIVDSDPVGTYNTFSYAANNNFTICPTPPTQTSASMNANGIQMFSKAYSATSTCASPSRVQVKLDKYLKGSPVKLYKSTGKVTSGSLDVIVGNGDLQSFGMMFKDYNESTGLFTFDSGYQSRAANTTTSFIFSDNTTQTNGYIAFSASTQPTISVIPNASLCSDLECNDILSARGTTAGVLSRITPSGWVSSCIYSAGKYSCPLTGFTEIPNCQASREAGSGTSFAASIDPTSTASTLVFGFRDGASTAFQTDFQVSCQKTGKDSKPKNFKVAGLNDISVSYWLPANFAASTTIPINFSSMNWDNCTPSCVSVSPTAWKFTAPKDGMYVISLNAQMSGSSAAYYIYRGGVVDSFIGIQLSTANVMTSPTIKLRAGEYVDIRVGASGTIIGNASKAVSPVASISIYRAGEY